MRNKDILVHKDGKYMVAYNKTYDAYFARCCKPVYPDEIFIYVSATTGLKIHKISCPNAAYLLSSYGYRAYSAGWFNSSDNHNISGSYLLENIDIDVYRAIMTNDELLMTLNSRKFEILLADILEVFGFEIELTKHTRDGGIDLIAIKHNDILGVQKYLLEAKRWRNKVGVQPVRSLVFLHGYHKASKSILVTTSEFTKGAWELQNEFKYTLDLKDRKALRRWVSTAAKLKYGL